MLLWRNFWDTAHRLYVNDRHREVHYRQVANDFVSVLPADDSTADVLDFGCGEALDAPRIAQRVGTLYLFDTSSYVRERLTARFAGAARIKVLDEAGYAALRPSSLDLIVVNSVVQYLSREEFVRLLDEWRVCLRPGGVLVIADVVSPESGLWADIHALLGTARRHGFLLAALGGLAATVVSDYRRIRSRVGLATYEPEQMTHLLEDAGFAAARRAENFGFNPKRMTFLARRHR